MLPGSVVYDSLIVGGGAAILGGDNQPVILAGDNLLLTLDYLHVLEVGLLLLVVLVYREFRDLHHQWVV